MPIIKVVLFDLGGVLVELGPNPIPNHWLQPNQTFQMEEWFKSETAIQFEKGLIGVEEFSSRLKIDLELQVNPIEIAAEFRKWPVRMYPGVENLFDKINTKIQLAVLSNTNRLHWPRLIGEFKLDQYIESKHLFASFQLAMAKPDPEIFLYVIDELAVKATDILFLDDNEMNIKTANEIGMNAVKVVGLEQVSNVLGNFGLLE